MDSPYENEIEKSEEPKSIDANDSPEKKRGAREVATDYARCIYHSLGALEKLLLLLFSGALALSVAGILFFFNSQFLVTVPAPGGSFTEGVVGTPRFINPVLAISDTDRDLIALVYSGLMRARPDGVLIPDLAETYSISEDGLKYTFTLKENALWQDGVSVTADDIIFTVKRIQDSALKSPKRASWEGVAVEKVNEKTVRFVLGQPYAPFLENTTLGIIPKHMWGEISSEQFGFSKFNTVPIGSGPYKIKSVREDKNGIPIYYDLVPFKNFSLGAPYISDLRIKFYQNEPSLLESLENSKIEAASTISPLKARILEGEGRRIETYLLPRVFGVFFNQNQNDILTSKTVRQALDTAAPRDEIVRSVLMGFGTSVTGPLPPGALGYTRKELAEKDESADDDSLRANEILQNGGWILNEETGIRERKGQELAFTLTTSNTEELKLAAEELQKAWGAIGAKVALEVFDSKDLNQNIIRPRKYEALLFGEIIGRESDPFAFWHSSQRNDPGLNIALYANITTDELLETGRTISDIKEREKVYSEFNEEIRNDTPAVFLYSPDFVYTIPDKVKGLTAGIITVPSERFLDIYSWHIETDRVWTLFQNK